MYVEEKNRSWCTSNGDNDNRAVTIECASDSKHPYAFNNIVYNKLIELCADICRRNGKDRLIWINNKDKALSYNLKPNEMLLTVHRWFAKKTCPGDWMFARMGDLADKVNAKLGSKDSSPVTEEPKELPYIVKITAEILTVRKGPGSEYNKVLDIKKGELYTIIEESKDKKWGKLKSGAGWINLNYTMRK
jgi:hypothetical protein